MEKNNKAYNITSLCKDDLIGHFTKKEIEKITDQEMKWIAGKMADAYVENSFWFDMEFFVKLALNK